MESTWLLWAAVVTDEEASLCRMRCEMREQQRRDLVRNLLGSKMPNAWQDFELIWRSDKFCRALCCYGLRCLHLRSAVVVGSQSPPLVRLEPQFLYLEMSDSQAY